MLAILFDKEEICYFSNHWWTPLHNASGNGHLEIVKCLVEGGADVNAKGIARRKRIVLFLKS